MDQEHIDAHRMVELEVYYPQTYLVNALLQVGYVDWDRVMNTSASSFGEVYEWWLVSSALADKLADKGEIVLKDYNCSWWGRTGRGQSLYMDEVMVELGKDYFSEPDFDPTRTGARG